MTTNPTDPNQVRLTGENSFIRLHNEEGGPMLTRASHWRVLYSPAGPGNVLYLKSDLLEDQVLVYSDNIALARWLQEEIESLLFPEFADPSLPVVDAQFTKAGDGRSFWTEKVESEEDNVLLTWHDFVEPFMLRVEAGSAPGRPQAFTAASSRRARPRSRSTASSPGAVLTRKCGATSKAARPVWPGRRLGLDPNCPGGPG